MSILQDNNALIKLSIFCHVEKDIVYHDLAGKTYQLDTLMLAIIEKIKNKPLSKRVLRESIKHPDFDEILTQLIKKKILVFANVEESSKFLLRRVDIETIRHCNAGCIYCPQSIRPKSSAIMEQEVFETVIAKLKDLKPIWVALNHFNEPLLDPHFLDRIDLLTKKNLPLFLFTNATLLSSEHIKYLKKANLHKVAFNFPSLNPRQWTEMMRLPEKYFHKAKDAIKLSLLLLSGEIEEIKIIINSITPDQKERVQQIKEYFGKFGEVTFVQKRSHSRANAITNHHVYTVLNDTPFIAQGCVRIASHLHVSWKGKCFLCCEDYDQKVLLGNLLTNTVDEIMTSKRANELRAEIYGLSPMRENLICRKCAVLRKNMHPI